MAEKSAVSTSAISTDAGRISGAKESLHSIESKIESQTHAGVDTGVTKIFEAQDDDIRESWGVFRKLTHTLLKWGVETHGCVLFLRAYIHIFVLLAIFK